jgi:predicted TIM-barrel fold metal-dependent hydrolase
MDRFKWPWDVLFDTAIRASPLFTLIDVGRLIAMLCGVSRVSPPQVRQIFGVDEQERQADLLREIINRTKHHQERGRPLPFRDALCDLVREHYAVHEANVQTQGRVSSRDLWEAFLRSKGAAQYKRVIVLSVNFDEAFLDDDLPGLDTFPTIDFYDQTAELEQLATHVNAEGGVQIVPFLGIDPRGHNADTLYDFVTQRVGSAKPFKGLKLYPPMGVLPTDDRLKKVFDYCQDGGFPVISHCSVGGAGVRGSNRNYADLAHPYKWVEVLNRLSKRAKRTQTKMFRLCLAHFDRLEDPDSVSWCDELMSMMQHHDGKHGNVEVYSDIAFDVITGDSRKTYGKNVERVQELGLTNRVLFGSDWWNYLYECDDEEAFIRQLKVDDGWWKTADFDAASERFLQDV